jgi:hypothetical protein
MMVGSSPLQACASKASEEQPISVRRKPDVRRK